MNLLSLRVRLKYPNCNLIVNEVTSIFEKNNHKYVGDKMKIFIRNMGGKINELELT